VFAQAGAKVILAARRQERLEQLADELSKFAAVHLLQLDVCDRSSVESALSTLPASWSSVDILINNAGLSRGLDKLHEASFQDWEEMIDTNIKGLLTSPFVVPGMVSRGRGVCCKSWFDCWSSNLPRRQCLLCNQSRRQSYFEG